ncbi:E3 ubiquitin-protein ligase TRAIP-like, partial [Vespa mandarinia]|uniref:E3 ubiquitin-protein ligase TRAIP-like n=1 Tax=Vespa mandarinia TaxID=7446 RepID=UPI0016072075
IDSTSFTTGWPILVYPNAPDLLTQPDDIFYTRCGHVFHFKCLSQWLERSKTCPQCREKVTHNRIHRLYLTVSNETTVESDPYTQDKLASLKFQILLKEKDINYFMSKNSTLEKQNAGLRREVRKLESETKEKNSAIYALKEQTKYFKEQLVGYESAKKEIIQLKKKLEELRNIQMLLDAPIEDVKDIIGRDKDPATLLTYITIMKKETISNLNKIKCLKIKMKNLQDEHAKLTMTSSQCYSNNRLLKEFTNCKKEKLALQTRVNELEKILGIAESSDHVVTGTLKNVKGKDEVTQEECLVSATLKKSVVKKRTHTISSPTKHNREHIVSKSNIEKNDASSSIVEIMDNECSKNYSKLRNLDSDTSIPLKKTRFSKMHEKTNDENDVLLDNSIENLLHICKHADTSTNAVSKAFKEKNEREKSSKMKHHEDIIDLT